MQKKKDTKIHNRFDICVESADGTTENYVQYNVVLDKLYTGYLRKAHYMPGGNYGGGQWCYGIGFGTGTGEVTASGSGLFKAVGFKEGTSVTRVYHSPTSGTYSMEILLQPHEFVGETLTEIGVGRSTSEIYTHSLIKDSHGNAIAIHKTDTDKIRIKATVFVELHDPEDLGVMWFSQGVHLKYLMGVCPHYNNGSYAMFANYAECAIGTWCNINKEVASTGATLTPEGIIKQSLSMGVNTANGRDIRSIILGEFHQSYGENWSYSCTVPLRGGDFPGVTYNHQRIATADGQTTEFRVPVEYRGIKTAKFKVDNQEVSVTTVKILGNNLVVGAANLPGEVTFLNETDFMTHEWNTPDSGKYYYVAARYRMLPNGRVEVSYRQQLPMDYVNERKWAHMLFMPEHEMLAVRRNSKYSVYHFNFETGELGALVGEFGVTEDRQRLYRVAGTNYLLAQNHHTGYNAYLYELKEGTLVQVKDLGRTVSGSLQGPKISGHILQGDYYQGNRLVKFSTDNLCLEVIATMPINRGIRIAPFTFAEIQVHPEDSTKQQLLIKETNSAFEVINTYTYTERFPKDSTDPSIYYIKDNVVQISSKTPYLVTFDPQNKQIYYRKAGSHYHQSSVDTGYGYRWTLPIPDSEDFMFRQGNVMVKSEMEIGAIRFDTPPTEGQTITCDFTLDYIPKNDSLTATLTGQLYWG